MLICIVVFTVPVAASAAGFVITEPGTLVGVGIAFVTVGLQTRQLFHSAKKKS